MSVRFSDGYYETDDKDEIRLLSRQSVVEVADTKAELLETAQDLDIEGRSEMTKHELAAEIVEETIE